MVIKIKTFIPNLQDDLHCSQACYIMAIEALTGEKISMEQAEDETRFIKDKLTWQYSALLGYAKRGIKVIEVHNENIELFVQDPKAMILELTEDENVTQEVIEMSDLENEVIVAKRVLANDDITIINKTPSLKDLENFIDSNHVVICVVNANILEDEEGYEGHAVIVENYDDNNVYLQDPGLPPQPNKKVTKNKFLRAWHSPNKKMANIKALKKGNN